MFKCKTLPKPDCCSTETAVSEPMEAVQTSSSARENSLYTCAGRFGSGCESGMMTLQLTE
jgi:hypothetical protein